MAKYRGAAVGTGQGTAGDSSEHATVADGFAAIDAKSAKAVQTGAPSDALELVVASRRQLSACCGYPGDLYEAVLVHVQHFDLALHATPM